MKFSAKYDYPVEPGDLFDLMCQPDFQQGKYAALGQRDVRLEQTDHDFGTTLVITRVMSINIPAFARRILKPENTVTQTEQWSEPDADGGRTATWSADTAGVPIKVGGTMRITPTESGCTHAIQGEVSAAIPLIGGKVADFAGGQANEQIRQEAEFTSRWIEENFE